MDKTSKYLIGILVIITLFISAEFIFIFLRKNTLTQTSISLQPSIQPIHHTIPTITTFDPKQPDKYFLPDGTKEELGGYQIIGSSTTSAILLFIGKLNSVSQTSQGIIGTITTKTKNGLSTQQVLLYTPKSHLNFNLITQKNNSFFPGASDSTLYKLSSFTQIHQLTNALNNIPVIFTTFSQLSDNVKTTNESLLPYLPCNKALLQELQTGNGQSSCLPLITSVHVYLRPGLKNLPKGN